MYGSKLVCQRSHLSLLEGDLRGKVVWITGASTGIGAALAVEAAKYGAKVAISARTHGKLEETKKRCIGSDEIFPKQASPIAALKIEQGAFNTKLSETEDTSHLEQKQTDRINNGSSS